MGNTKVLSNGQTLQYGIWSTLSIPCRTHAELAAGVVNAWGLYYDEAALRKLLVSWPGVLICGSAFRSLGTHYYRAVPDITSALFLELLGSRCEGPAYWLRRVLAAVRGMRRSGLS